MKEIHPDVDVHKEFKEGGSEHFVMDWNSEEYAQGAFALFGPSQFSELWPHIVEPAADGLLHFAGEATSYHHAWIVGALDSAYRAVWEILSHEESNSEEECDKEKFRQLKKKMVRNWGPLNDVPESAELFEQEFPTANVCNANKIRKRLFKKCASAFRH